MNIRLAKGEDLPLLNDIERVCFTSERFPLDVLRAMLREKGFLTLIAEEAGTGVAYATMFHKDRRARAQLASIAVLPEHRKKGIATTLLHRIEDAAHEKGAKLIALEVSVNNVSAIDLYTSNGYLVLGNIKGYYGPGKDAYYMEKGLGHTQFS